MGIVTQRGTWKSWLLYMLDAVEETALLTNQLISNILGQIESTLEYAKTRFKWYNKEVNELLFSQPYIKPKLISDASQVSSRTTLTKYFGELVDAQILTPKKDGREVFYINEDLVWILEG